MFTILYFIFGIQCLTNLLFTVIVLKEKCVI